MTVWNSKKTVALAALVAAGCAAAKYHGKKKLEKKKEKLQKEFAKQDFADSHAYFVGGGLAGMAGAAYLIRDCRFQGSNITIFESMEEDEIRQLRGEHRTEGGFCPGIASLQESMSENFWELFSGIPSLTKEGTSVMDEMLCFAHVHPIDAGARLIGHGGRMVPTQDLELNRVDRRLLRKLMAIPEEKLDDQTIRDWFAQDTHFFTTNFWYIWRSTFAFQPWSSLFELRRSLLRMIGELAKDTILSGMIPTASAPHTCFLHPLRVYLEKQGVRFVTGISVDDMDFADKDEIQVKKLYLHRGRKEQEISVETGDLVFMTVGSMLEQMALGDLDHKALIVAQSSPAAKLWNNIASKADGLGKPDAFFYTDAGNGLESLTITSRGDLLAGKLRKLTGCDAQHEARMIFRDSAWVLTCVVPAESTSLSDGKKTSQVWLYGLNTEQKGDFIRKPMQECTGREIVQELLYQMYAKEFAEEILEQVEEAIPCFMPHAETLHQPRKKQDRPLMVPEGSRNFAMIGQFVEVPKDMVFTEEYSVRTARTAVYKLTGHPDTVCPVTAFQLRPNVWLRALGRLLR